jgi:uncharacterized membrane protein HdeD (DUF308 family)
MDKKSIALNLLSWIFGIVFFTIGVLNIFWGKDPGFGAFLVLLSFIYFPPVNAIFRKMTGFSHSRNSKNPPWHLHYLGFLRGG